MKRSEIALIVLVVGMTVLGSYFLGQFLLPKQSLQAVDVEKIDAITADFVAPSAKVFNADAINPTVAIKIGDTNSQQPFSGN